ncbi:MAG: 1-acyl-sn-glycerol-3-phosphate acyltransferase [Cryobacterium sp.]|nr:1-acyl-sn-glycerol-3-phosphate acyltransferase [Oligoflexia bacterium]
MILWLIISSTLMTALALFRWKNPENNHTFGKVYGPLALRIMGIEPRAEGQEYLQNRPAVFVANHQSGMDLAAFSSIFPLGAAVIGKKEIRYIPGFGLMFEAFGNVLINRQNRSNALGELRETVALMKKKNMSVFIFPEGTRNPLGEGLLPFKKGAFYMAIQAQSPIVPMICSKMEPLVSFRHRYARSGVLVLKVLPPISTVGLTQADVELLLKKTRDVMMAELVLLNQRAAAVAAERAAIGE